MAQIHPMDEKLQIAVRFFERLDAGDIPGALALMTDVATWRTAGRRELLPAAGTYDKARLRKLFERMYARLPGGLRMTVVATTGAGDRWAVEARSSGDLENGRQYRQEYCFVIRLDDGKIAEVREYLDTQHVHDVWFRE